MSNYDNFWLPETVLVIVFSYLPYCTLCRAAQVCRTWRTTAYTKKLWYMLCRNHYPSQIEPAYDNRKWRCEFQRLYYEIPTTIVQHSDEVLDVCFSHDGILFVTCSKDAFFKVWNTTSLSLLHESNMEKSSGWDLTLRSRFNSSDVYLLVCGLHRAVYGELAIFSVKDFTQIRKVMLQSLRPVYASWFDDNTVISTSMPSKDRKPVARQTCISMLKISQNSVPETCHSYSNSNYSNIQWILVAEFNTTEGGSNILHNQRKQKFLIYPLSRTKDFPNAIGIKMLNMGRLDSAEAATDTIVCSEHDFIQDLDKQVVGACLSPDQKTLYIACHPLIDGLQNSVCRAVVKRELVISVIDLKTLTNLGPMFKSNASDNSNGCGFLFTDQCNFLFPDVSSNYVACGDEESNVCLWKCQSGVLICKLPSGKDKIVSSVMFDPKNDRKLWAVCDDKTIKIWRLKKQNNFDFNQ